MSEHSINCSCDDLCCMTQDSLFIGMTRYGHLHVTSIYFSLCKVETATRLLKFFSSSLPVFYFMTGLYEKRLRPVLKPNLVVEIETIPSCLTANLDLYIFT